MDTINAVGRRKSAIARVYLTKGSGEIKVNGKSLEEYFPTLQIKNKVTKPIETVELEEEYNININVKGGGYRGQAEAVQLGIARALVKLNEDFKPALKAEKMMTRDSRVVERKKYGKPKARKSFQFSKR